MPPHEQKLSWGHININVSDLDRSIAFYERLGFTLFIPGIPYLGLSAKTGGDEIPPEAVRALGLPEGTRGRACILQLGDGFPKLDLTELENQTSRQPLTSGDLGLVRLCLATRDLKQVHADLQARGVEFLSGPEPCADRMADIAICVDPDGTLIELIEVFLDRWP